MAHLSIFVDEFTISLCLFPQDSTKMRMMNQMSSNENLGTEEDAQTVSVDEGEVVKETAGEEGEEDDENIWVQRQKN